MMGLFSRKRRPEPVKTVEGPAEMCERLAAEVIILRPADRVALALCADALTDAREALMESRPAEGDARFDRLISEAANGYAFCCYASTNLDEMTPDAAEGLRVAARTLRAAKGLVAGAR